jgi:DNA-binding NarL/FixJ family response regulator
MEKSDGTPPLDRLEEVWEHCSEIAGDVQALSHELHSSMLDLLGLTAATKNFCREFSNQQGMVVEFAHSGVPEPLPRDVSLCLFRVVQEACTMQRSTAASTFSKCTCMERLRESNLRCTMLARVLTWKLLEPQYEVAGCVGDGRALLKAAAELRPDVVLLDITMPLLNGLDAGRELKKMMPNVKLIYLTMNTNSEFAGEALRAGASAYVLKNAKSSELLRAIDDALRGISFVSLQIRQAMEETFIRDPKAVARPKHLTDRQVEVLQMLAEGRTMQQIADILQITHRTVRFHKCRIMEELEITTNAELVHYAMKHGMISSA